MAQYVYSLNRVGKIVPPKRQILKDISLSFFPGAKIGLLPLVQRGHQSVEADGLRSVGGDRDGVTGGGVAECIVPGSPVHRAAQVTIQGFAVHNTHSPWPSTSTP